jgi:hypothetical protein
MEHGQRRNFYTLASKIVVTPLPRTKRHNGEAQRRQVTFETLPRFLFRPLQRSVSLRAMP